MLDTLQVSRKIQKWSRAGANIYIPFQILILFSFFGRPLTTLVAF